jgi:hypothetical protein
VKRNQILWLAVLVMLCATLGTGGCRRVKLADTPGTAGGAAAQSQTVPLGAATALVANVRMGVGTLKLAAGEPSSTLALDGSFSYPVASWKPEVLYSVESTQGTLSVSQPEFNGPPPLSLGDAENSWRIKLPPGVPTELSLKLGVGESDISLRGIDVTSFEVLSGVGQTKIDLSGPRAHDIKGTIEAGVGEVHIVVPRSVGVRLVGGTEGVGELSAPGFTDSSGGLVNSAWGQPGPKIELDLSRGVGEITVTSVD